MIDFFSNLELDKQSFWLGFIAGAIFLWFVSKLRSYLPRAFYYLKHKYIETREGLTSNAELKYRNETLYYLQKLHLMSPMFSLDEISIPPRLIVPITPKSSDNSSQVEDIVNLTIPYLPDWPELSAKYKAPTISIAEALSKGANLILIGQPGSGKTVAIAQLASSILRKIIDQDELINFLPIYIHAQDITSPGFYTSPLENILEVLSKYLSLLTQQRAPSLLQTTFEKNRALLLIDGLDEISFGQYQITLEFLKSIIEKYPNVRLIVATSPYNFPFLDQFGLIPVFISPWNEEMIFTYLKSFNKNWGRLLHPNEVSEEETIDSLLIRSWFEDCTLPQTPLELTLKIWSAHAGDILGVDINDNLEAYIRRTTSEYPDARNILEQISAQMINNGSFKINQDEVLALLDKQNNKSEFVSNEKDVESEIQSERLESEIIIETPSKDLKFHTLLQEFTHKGLLVALDDQAFRLSHPLITCYLAGSALAKTKEISFVLEQSEWTGKFLTISNYLYFCDGEDRIIDSYLDKEDILYKKTLMAARWLKHANSNSVWQSKLMRYLATKMQDESITLGLSGRFLSSLSLVNDAHIGTLFRKLLSSDEANIRQLSALGCGLIKDIKSVPEVAILINDPIPEVCRAACLALAAIGNKNALETLATVLIQGSEAVKKYAAEALANHKDEGHPALRDGSKMEDLLVRRAVVFGLARVNESWALEILEKIQLEDQQWLVRNAAVQVIEDLKRSKPYIPTPAIPLSDESWLIEFASKLGIGVVPGKPAIDLLKRALRDGDEALRIEGLSYLRLNGIPELIPTITEVYHTSLGEVREAAFNTLWHLSAFGYEINKITG